jgi:hypothetical protein
MIYRLATSSHATGMRLGDMSGMYTEFAPECHALPQLAFQVSVHGLQMAGARAFKT